MKGAEIAEVVRLASQLPGTLRDAFADAIGEYAKSGAADPLKEAVSDRRFAPLFYEAAFKGKLLDFGNVSQLVYANAQLLKAVNLLREHVVFMRDSSTDPIDKSLTNGVLEEVAGVLK